MEIRLAANSVHAHIETLLHCTRFNQISVFKYPLLRHLIMCSINYISHMFLSRSSCND